MADKPPEPLLADAAGAAPTGEALDLACGIGRHTLWLARHGWQVTAVDASRIALDLLEEQAADLTIRTVHADLEEGEFAIEPAGYDLIVDTCFLYRPLFPAIRSGLRPGGVFFGVFPLEGDTSGTHNPAFLIGAGELPGYFAGWEILHYAEGRPAAERRMRAEIVARRGRSPESQELP